MRRTLSTDLPSRPALFHPSFAGRSAAQALTCTTPLIVSLESASRFERRSADQAILLAAAYREFGEAAAIRWTEFRRLLCHWMAKVPGKSLLVTR